MNTELAKDIFFFVGSILGIVAFFKGALEPLMEANRKKWNELRTKISENDLRDLGYEVSMSRRIDAELLTRLNTLIRDIEEDAEYVRFGWPLRRHYIKHLSRFVTAYHNLQQYLSVPYWQWRSSDQNDESDRGVREFQKDYFFRSDYRGVPYDEHLRQTEIIVEKLRLEHRILGILSGLSAIEFPFVRWLLRSRVRLPLSHELAADETKQTDATATTSHTVV